MRNTRNGNVILVLCNEWHFSTHAVYAATITATPTTGGEWFKDSER
jgi:hypothetical protein